ncbi:MAG: FG-GAP repeat protein [Xanthomonadales bacterium]|jgi:hypothetical protein|nr:FG-GAP repeat protein [Xanthomonadales bacterium]
MKQTHYLTFILLMLVIPLVQSIESINFSNRLESVNEQKSVKSLVHDAKLLPDPSGSGGNGVSLGYSISIDGNRALVGAPNLENSGSVFVFEFDGSNWNQTSSTMANGA